MATKTGERVPLDLVIENLRRIARATDLPVTIDLESGYGRTPEAVGRTVERSIEAGAVGCNLEDSEPGSPDDEETYGGGSRRRSYLDPPRATATMGLTLWSPWLFLLLQIAIAKIAPSRTLRTSPVGLNFVLMMLRPTARWRLTVSWTSPP